MSLSSFLQVWFLVSLGISPLAKAGPSVAPELLQTPPVGHQEAPNDAYLPPRSPRVTSPPRPPERLSRDGFLSVQVNVDEFGNNIVGDAANEPSIAVDPANLRRMVIGWRQFDTIESNFRQAGYAYSHDRGETWTFPGVLEPGVFRSDPILSVDADGVFYY